MSGYTHALPRLRLKRPSPPGWSTWWKGMIALILLQAARLVFITLRHPDTLSIILDSLWLAWITFALFIFRKVHDMWAKLEEEGRSRPVPKSAWLLQAFLWAWTIIVWALL